MNIIAQVCGLVIMLVLVYFYQTQRKVKLNTGRAFMGIWSIAMLSLMLDIAMVIAVSFRGTIPEIIITIVCKAYLISLVWEAIFALRYVCIDIFVKNKMTSKWNVHLTTLALIDAVLIGVLPIRKDVAMGNGSYTYGASVVATYIMGVTLLGAICLIMHIYKEQIDVRRKKGVCIWAVLFILAAMVQFLQNNIIIVDYATVVGLVVIYLLKENPETNLDRDTGLFNLNAFFAYTKQLRGTGLDVSILCVSFDSNRNGSMSYDVEKIVHLQIVDFIGNIPSATAFRSSATEFLLVFEKEEYGEGAIATILKRFEKPWGEDDMRLVSVEWYLLESTSIIERTNDVLPIFQYARQNRATLADNGGVRISDIVISRMYEERDMENEIIDAMVEDRVEIFYQPIYSTKEQEFTSAEALVRIRDRDGKIIPPNKFIDVAEKRGLIIRLGEVVFEKVCKMLVEEDPCQYGLKYIEVNLSMIQCAYEHLADDFINIMEKYRVDPSKIVLEITESASIKEKQILLTNMKKLKNMGVKFALDDFGTGQSNLNYIVEMPVDVVKFDSTMTNAYFEDGKAKYVMDAAMQMIQGMDLEIVSEGIEKQDQYHTMEKLGIDYIQGYYFSKPVESDAFIDFMRDKKPE